jgi:hypothetical protein
VVAIISLGCLIIAIRFLFLGEIITSTVLFLLSFVMIYYILDFHGFQLNKSTHQIRDYKDFMGVKFGKWHNLDDFKSIYLIKAHLVLPIFEEEKAETFHYYHIKLVDEINKKELFLAEYTNYYKAFSIADNVAELTGLELKDFVKGSVKNKV